MPEIQLRLAISQLSHAMKWDKMKTFQTNKEKKEEILVWQPLIFYYYCLVETKDFVPTFFVSSFFCGKCPDFQMKILFYMLLKHCLYG